MVGRNSAALIAQIGQMSTPKITEGKSLDIARAVEAGLKGYDWGKNLREQKEQTANRDALITALQSGDEEAIAQARAKVDPVAYASLLDTERQAEKEFQRKLALKKAELELGKTYDITPQMKNIKYLVGSGEMTLSEAIDLVYGRNKPENLSPYEKEKQKQQAKAEVERQVSQQGFEQVKNKAKSSIEQAEKALKSGTGLGLFGGSFSAVGLSTEKGQQNRADVETANIQMNLVIRQALKDAGVQSKELDAAAESVAYRYKISPFDDENTALRKIGNFKEDFLGDKKPVFNNLGQLGVFLENYKPSANGTSPLTPTMSFLQQGLSNAVPQGQQTSFVNSPKTQTIGRLKVTEVK